jgi:hypothetical protein
MSEIPQFDLGSKISRQRRVVPKPLMSATIAFIILKDCTIYDTLSLLCLRIFIVSCFAISRSLYSS